MTIRLPRRLYLASAISVAAPLLLLAAANVPAYAAPGDDEVVPDILGPADPHTGAPLQGPILADFAPLQPPGISSPDAALFPGPVIATVPAPNQVVEIILGPDNPLSQDYTGPPIAVPTLPSIPIPSIPMPSLGY